jgi:plasmid stabilization system protein ParE
MPQIKIVLTASAENNILQIRDFYREIPDIGKRAIDTVKGGLFRLVEFPNIGKPNPEDEGITRLLPIGFGGSGYLVKYRFIENENTIVILGIRAFKQAGFYE